MGLIRMRLVCQLALGLGVYFASNAGAQMYQIVDIGSLGGDDTFAYDINNLDQIAGVSQDASGEFRGFIWTDGSMLDLDQFGGEWTSSLRLNDLGHVAGIAVINNMNTAAFFDGVNVVELPPPSGHDRSEAFAINNADQVVGRSWWVNPDDNYNHSYAIAWDNTVPRILPDLGGRTGQAVAINNLGDAVGYLRDDLGAYHPVLWPFDGGVTSLLGEMGQLTDINDAGQITGWINNAEGGRTAALWSNSVVTDLGYVDRPFGGSAPISEATSINSDGIISGWSTTRQGGNHSLYWEETLLFDADKLSTGDGYLGIAPRINDARNMVVNGSWTGGDRGFLLELIDQALDLVGPVPGIAGEVNSITVTNATPDEDVYFVVNFSGGSTNVPSCGSLQVVMDSPIVIDIVTADATGTAITMGPVSGSLAGKVLVVQAVQTSSCLISNPEVHRFE